MEITYEKIQNLVNIAINHFLANSRFNDPFLIAQLKNVPFHINTRMRTTGGTCAWKRSPITRNILSVNIEFGLHYMTRATDAEVFNTVAHELAHAYQVLKTGDTGHDSLWRAIHLAMGGNASRTHQVKTVKQNRVWRAKFKEVATGKVYEVRKTLKEKLLYDIEYRKSHPWCGPAKYEFLGMVQIGG